MRTKTECGQCHHACEKEKAVQQEKKLEYNYIIKQRHEQTDL